MMIDLRRQWVNFGGLKDNFWQTDQNIWIHNKKHDHLAQANLTMVDHLKLYILFFFFYVAINKTRISSVMPQKILKFMV